MRTFFISIPFLLFSCLFFAQGEKFELNQDSPELINQYVVLKKDSMPVDVGFQKIIEWININYNTPKEVIKSQLENEYIRMQGYSKSLTSYKFMGGTIYAEGKYSISFEFKENKIKMEITNIEIYNTPSEYTRGGWIDYFPSLANQTKKNGKTHKQLEMMFSGIVDSMNNLQISIQDYLENGQKSSIEKDRW